MISFDIATLGRQYEAGLFSPREVIEDLLARLEARGNDGVWINVADRERLLADARKIERRRAAGEVLPLFGLPFAVKDNIDVAGLPTTVACAPFAYTPDRHATVVERLLAAGAICVGKTNMDQFATGLVGVRSPFGIPRNLFDHRYIVGGSSSGSGVAVAAGLVSFALGTDTAGSGRVPAAFNNIVGLKPSRGLLSTAGVVPACRSFDCVSIFALTVEDATRVADVARGFDPEDPASRREAERIGFAGGPRPSRFRYGVPRSDDLDFLGDTAAAELFEGACARLDALGGERVDVDFTLFRKAGALLYDGPFVAERLSAAGRILSERPDALVIPLRAIFEPATRIEARAVFEAQHKLGLLRRRAETVLAELDFLLVPTTPTIYEIEAVEADPRRLNATLGTYTNFVNLLDLCGVAVPAGLRKNGLPAGVTLAAPWGRDAHLAPIASALHRATSATLGATGQPFPAVDPRTAPDAGAAPGGTIPIAVVGAHLSGQPLNHQLTHLGGSLVRAARTAPSYRLYALPNTVPPKPGLVRVDAEGVAIELEVWGLSPEAFGTFVSRVPSPLCIGSVELEDGTRVSGFLCEGHALAGARDISSFGGWRRYIQS